MHNYSRVLVVVGSLSPPRGDCENCELQVIIPLEANSQEQDSPILALAPENRNSRLVSSR
jgi:hypothetical protein